MAFINKHDTNGTKGLLAKGELGYDDYTAGGDVGRVYVGTGNENIALAEKLESNMMTKAQFNALAEERKANRAGSGFDEFGKQPATFPKINEGMWTGFTTSYSNSFTLGYEYSDSSGVSKTPQAIASINGVLSNLSYLNVTYARQAKIQLPPAPTIYPYDTVLTAEQIASGVIKHADASNSGLIVNGKFDTDTSGWVANGTLVIENGRAKHTVTVTTQFFQGFSTVIGKKYIIEFSSEGQCTPYMSTNSNSSGVILNAGFRDRTGARESYEFTATTSTTYFVMYSTVNEPTYHDNIAVYPADAISRSDLSFLESWHEDISEKNFVYPLGNVQYLGTNTDGLTGITNGAFIGFEQYSLFGNWQTSSALIGKGYVWSSLTESQKRAFIANPDNNCYLDGDKVIQVRYRVRVVQGWGDSGVNTYPYNNNLYTTSGGYVRPKGKQVSISSEWGEANTLGIYGHGTSNWTANLPYANEVGIFSASSSYGSTTGFTAGSYNGQCFALPIAIVHRRNQGMYHPVYNPNGTRNIRLPEATKVSWYYNSTTVGSIDSISKCFTFDIDYFGNGSTVWSSVGAIGTSSGRPDGLFYDQVHEGDILDLRNSSKKVEDYNRLISREFNKLVAGTNRGKESEWYTSREISNNGTANNVVNIEVVNTNNKINVGDIVQVFFEHNSSSYRGVVTNAQSTFIVVAGVTYNRVKDSYHIISVKSQRTKSNTLLHCDIIGNPAKYPTAWKESGVSGTPLIVAEDGTSLLPDGAKDTFKLSRKANATPLLCLRSIDSGATWTSFTPTFNTITNEITLTNEPANNLVMVYYQTHTSMAATVANSEVLEIGEVFAGNSYISPYGAYLVNSLIGKTPAAATTAPISANIRFKLSSVEIDLANFLNTGRSYQFHEPVILPVYSNPAVKVFPYLTRLNGKAYLNLVFKEMKHNGTSWGDDSKFNITASNVSTTTDNNAQTVLIGQKTVELNVFIGDGE